MYKLLICIAFFGFFGCKQAEKIDLLIVNAHIQTVDSNLTVFEAIAIRNGTIVALGTSIDLHTRFKADTVIDLKGGFVYPGFYDAHCHFYGYANNLLTADLYSCSSEEDLGSCVAKFAAQNQEQPWILGRGWDQTRWPGGAFPSKKILDSLFPDKPVLLTRIDGHAALASQKALDLAGITAQTKVKGGSVVVENGQLTGLLIDMAIEEVKKLVPEQNPKLLLNAIKQAEKNCFAVGLTTLTDAGLPLSTIKYLDSLQQANEISIRLNIMLEASDENFEYFARKGFYKTEKLQINSFKIYGDGALGSRGAYLLTDYFDQPGNRGFSLFDSSFYASWAFRIAETSYQMNTHCIGDAANRQILQIYKLALANKPNRRWRIEHAQVVSPSDKSLFGSLGVVPSVQPTHATSDMRWAAQRLGPINVKNAYAYQDLFQQNGWIALGSDFPVEDINPLYGFFAAVNRTDANGNPKGGWQIEQKLTREQALRGITIWAAKANFEEEERGSLEIGKKADLVVLSANLLSHDIFDVRNATVNYVFLGGKLVFNNAR